MTLHARGEHFLHGEATGRDLRDGARRRRRQDRAPGAEAEEQVDGAEAPGRLGGEGGIGRAAARARAPRRGPIAGEDGNAVRIIRARRYAVKPMSVDEAALEVGDGRDAFLVFRNAATDAINVLFRRPDGNLGLIEPEA